MAAKESHPEASPSDCAPDGLNHDERCPLCGRDNQCRVAKGHLYKGPCWCHQIIVPGHILNHLAKDTIDPACLCRSCLETVARISREQGDTETILAEVRKVIVAGEPDFYLDENGNTVFTAAYHLKRGTCCESKCRHCPY